MKGRTGSTLSRTKYVKCFRVETSCYRVVLRLKFIVTVELLYEQAESDCGPLPLGSAVNLNKLNLIEIELFIKKYFMESALLYNPTMKQTNLRAGCKLVLQPGTMTGRRSETFLKKISYITGGPNSRCEGRV